jgi:hypothetical protein
MEAYHIDRFGSVDGIVLAWCRFRTAPARLSDYAVLRRSG